MRIDLRQRICKQTLLETRRREKLNQSESNTEPNQLNLVWEWCWFHSDVRFYSLFDCFHPPVEQFYAVGDASVQRVCPDVEMHVGIAFPKATDVCTPVTGYGYDDQRHKSENNC